MNAKEKEDIKRLMSILMQLDKNSLLIVDSGARMLLARQNMDKERKNVSKGGSRDPCGGCQKI